MGGKNKQAQRTKNNARPSSSSRSAEMLGSTVPNFVGFSAAKDGGGLVAIVPGFSIKEDIDPNIDPNFQLVLKKFGKKDPITKLKALSEFTVLVNNSEEAIVCAALSLWPRYYCQLSTDVEHRIREGAQVAHGAVVKKCGRSVAPYLKQLIPVWITSQYDTYVPAAMQAQAALEAVFPSTKLPDVLGFCKAEIMSYIVDNLTLHTSNTLSNSKTYTAEEREAKLERVIISSLQGYSLLVNYLPDAHLDWLCEEQTKLLDNDKFWSYGTHEIPQIRTSLYTVIGSLCQRLGSWFGSKYGSKATELVLSQLSDKELNVTLAAWENAIILMAKVPEWYKLVQFNEKVLPAICETLGAGGWGSAGRIAPLILPLLAHIPPEALDQEGCDVFFDAIIKGAKQRCVVSSKSECTSWMNGLAECVRFISVSRGPINNDFRLQCLSKIMRQWLLYILRSHLSINPYTPLKVSIPFISDLIKFWIKQSFSTQSADSLFFTQLLRLFWQNVVFVITSQLQEYNCDTDNKEIMDVHYELLVGLKTNMHSKTKKVLKVKFDSDEKTDDEVTKIAEKLAEQELNTELQTKQVYERELNSIVNEICGLYLVLAKDKCISAPILTPLYSIIIEFKSAQIFSCMLNATLKNKTNNIQHLYTELFLNWLKGDAMRSQAVVDITFVMFNYLTDEQQRDILKSFDQVPLSVIRWCISSCLSFPYKRLASVKDWLHSDLVHQSLISMTQLVVKEGDSHHAALLKMCFAQDDDGNILLSSKTCTSIIKVLAVSLRDHNAEHLDICASFASQLVTTLCSDETLQGFDELLISLFTINCSTRQGESEVLSEDTWWEVSTSWQDALSSLGWDQLVAFATLASNVVFQSLINMDNSSINNEIIDNLVDLSFNLLCACCKTTHLNESNISSLCFISIIIMRMKCKQIESWFKAVYSKSLVSSLLVGTLDYSAADKTNNILNDIVSNSNKTSYDDLCEAELSHLLSWSLFCTKFVDKIFDNCNKTKDEDIDEDCDEEEEQSVDDDVTNILECEDMNVILGNIVYNTAVVKVLYDEYKALRWHIILQKFYLDIENAVSHTIKLLSDAGYNQFLEFMKIKVKQDNMFWLLSLEMCSGVWRKSQNIVIDEACFNLTFNPSEVKEELFDDFIKKQLGTCSLPSKDCNILKSNETILNMTGILALRAVYLCCIGKVVDVSLTKLEIISNINKPLATLTLIVDKYHQYKKLMLYDTDFSKTSWELVSCNSSIIRFLTTCVTQYGWDLEPHQWDFINITISSMMQSVDRSKHAWNTTKVSLLSCEVFKLFCAVDKFITEVPTECAKREPGPCIPNLPQEWMDIFSPNIHEHLIEIICKLFDSFSSIENLPSRDIFYVNALYEAMKRFSVKFLLTNRKHSVDTITNYCLEILSAQTPHLLKYMAREMLIIITPSLIEADRVASNTSITVECDPPRPNLSVYKMVNALTHLQECVDAVLSPYLVGESNCILLPFTDSYNITLGYFILWETLLNIVQEAITYLQYQYTEFFRQGKYVEHLVCAIFRLIPDDSQLTSANYYKNPIELLAKVAPSSELISSLACKCLVQSLRVGAVHVGVRGWWGALVARTAQHVERVVRTHITPILVQHQLNEVTTRQKELPNVEFSIHPSVNEIVCKYTVDSTKMELTIELCSNHPLGIPRVSSSGGPTSNVAWITLYLSHQNGTLWQTIILWLNSIQKKLDSVSECYVCYCKLHPVTGKLPKITCQTCKNKSHSICLKKWFSTSGKSTCPMCRSVITLK